MLVSRRNMMIGGAMGAAVAPVIARAAIASPTPSYSFGPDAGIARLGLNENPYGPSPRALTAIEAAGKKGAYYANEANMVLMKMIADKEGVSPDQVVIGSGSSEVLNAIAMVWKAKGAYLGPDLFWDTTALYGARHGATIKRAAMTADMDTDLPALAAAVDPSIGLVHLVNPNNPTGVLIDGERLRGFIKAVAPKTTVMVDEAYMELTDKPDYSSMIDMVKAGHDVIITRTFSKIFGLAGMRIGYAITSAANAKLIRDNMMTSLSVTSLAAAITSYDDEAFKSYSKGKIVEARQMIDAAVKGAGLTALPSAANFVFVKVADADAVQKRMAAKGIMIRGPYGKWTSWSRVSTGKIEDVARYCKALPEVVKA